MSIDTSLKKAAGTQVTTVGIADMVVSTDPDAVIVTHALGSCLGITVSDTVAGVGGMIHVMLPSSTIDPARAVLSPFTFVDTGVPCLFRAAYAAGADRARIVVKVAGGASHKAEEDDLFQIGKRNMVMLRKLLWKNGIMIEAQDVGGSLSRTMALHVATGDVELRTGDTKRKL